MITVSMAKNMRENDPSSFTMIDPYPNLKAQWHPNPNIRIARMVKIRKRNVRCTLYVPGVRVTC